jgi:hypothetical protein
MVFVWLLTRLHSESCENSVWGLPEMHAEVFVGSRGTTGE